MFCIQCGKPIPEGSIFCPYCGAAVIVPDEVPKDDPFSAPQLEPHYDSFLPYDPTPIPESVIEPNPEVMPTPAAGLEEPLPPVKKKKNTLQLILIPVLVVVAIVSAILLFKKKTVYLVTENVTENLYSITTMQYRYDNEGRITKYVYELESLQAMGIDTKLEISYKYSKDGKLESAELTRNHLSSDIEYTYKNGVMDGIEVDWPDGDADIDIEFNKDNRIEYIALLNEDGEEYLITEYQYHQNGTVKEMTQENPRYNTKTMSRYNENGKILESAQYYNGEQSHCIVYDYDKNGNMIIIEQYGEDDELMSKIDAEPSYKGNQLDGLVLTLETQKDGEKYQAEVIFEAEWDDLECTLTIDRIDGDEESLDLLGFNEDGEVEIIFEKDKYGNTVKTEMIVNGETSSKTTTEYKAVKLPRKYIAPNVTVDPQYLFFLFNY